MFFNTHNSNSIIDNVFCDSCDGSKIRNPLIGIPLLDLVCSVGDECPSQCKCINRPHNRTLHIECYDVFLRIPPQAVPHSNESKHKLDFSKNKGLQLQPRDYFKNTTIFDASYCDLEMIEDVTWAAISEIDSVFLNGNRLSTLPSHVIKTNLSIKRLSLSNNTRSCSCENRWIKAYFKSIEDILQNANEIVCSSPLRLNGKNIFLVSDEEFCEDPAMTMLKIAAASFTGVLFVILLLGIIFSRFRIKLHATLNVQPFDRDECEGEQMEYDVVLCFAQGDSVISRKLLLYLESRDYKMCYHLRDFPPGETIFCRQYLSICEVK